MRKLIDLTGLRFGRLIVKKKIENNKYGKVYWECQCDCGNIKKVRGTHLKSGDIKSCGCLSKERSCAQLFKHGHAKKGAESRTYISWQGAHQRCNDHNSKDYKNYGGRGIKLCERWNDFENFLEDMGERPRGTSIERKDNDGNYEPGNCRWSSAIVQAHNRRNTKLTTLKVQVIKKLLRESKLMQKEIAEIFDVTRCAIYSIKTGKTWSNITYKSG